MTRKSRGADRTERFRRKRSRKSRRPLAIAGIAAFLIVDVALVGYAVVNGRSASADIAAIPSSPSPLAPERSATPSTSAAPAPTDSATSSRPAERFLSAVSDSVAWRSSAGSCTVGDGDGESAAVERTTDGGATWSRQEVTGLSSVVRVSAVSTEQAFVIGQRSGSCEMTLAVTYSAGTSFVEHPDDLASAWYIPGTDPGHVHSPDDAIVTPCTDVLELGVSSATTAFARCADGSLVMTQTGGSAWAAHEVQGEALALSADGKAVLVSDASSCSVVPTSDGPAVAAPENACASDPIGLAVSDTRVWMWIGDSVSTVARA